ncbi:MAG: hypothetical protein ACRBFS_23320 [Aureispira sp.]
MKFFFYLFLSIYWLTYLLPFAYDRTGYEIEFVLWSAIFDNQPTLSGFTIVWSLRCLINALILAVCWIRLPQIQRWLFFHIDVSFLYQLLCGFALVLLGYAFSMTHVRWNWGAFVWAISALFTVLSYYWIQDKPEKILQEQSKEDLHQHLVPLEES